MASIRDKLQVYLSSEDWKNKKKTIDYSKIEKYRYRYRYKSDENFDKNTENNKIRLEDEILKDMIQKKNHFVSISVKYH